MIKTHNTSPGTSRNRSIDGSTSAMSDAHLRTTERLKFIIAHHSKLTRRVSHEAGQTIGRVVGGSLGVCAGGVAGAVIAGLTHSIRLSGGQGGGLSLLTCMGVGGAAGGDLGAIVGGHLGTLIAYLLTSGASLLLALLGNADPATESADTPTDAPINSPADALSDAPADTQADAASISPTTTTSPDAPPVEPSTLPSPEPSTTIATATIVTAPATTTLANTSSIDTTPANDLDDSEAWVEVDDHIIKGSWVRIDSETQDTTASGATG